MPRKSDKAAIDKTTQRKRFVEASRTLGVDEDEDAFDRILKKVASTPSRTPTSGKLKKSEQNAPKHRDDKIPHDGKAKR